MAQTAIDPAVRHEYLNLAYQWRELAEQAVLADSVAAGTKAGLAC